MVRDGRHCFDGAPEEAPIGGPVPERASSVLRHAAEGETRSGFSRQRAAQSLDLLRYEGGGGDVSVSEVTDLLQCLACG